jgi:hypothetical protein
MAAYSKVVELPVLSRKKLLQQVPVNKVIMLQQKESITKKLGFQLERRRRGEKELQMRLNAPR